MWRAFGKGSWDAKARKPGNMITAAQCRSARTLLGWSLNKLSSVASVPERVIDDFEVERRCRNADCRVIAAELPTAGIKHRGFRAAHDRWLTRQIARVIREPAGFQPASCADMSMMRIAEP